MNNEMIALPRSVAGILMSAAEVRREQYDRHAKGLDPYEADCVYECDKVEAENLATMYKEAIEAYVRAKRGS